MKIGFSIWKFYRVCFSDSKGFEKQLIVDEDTFKYLRSLPMSKHAHFVAFAIHPNEIVERSKSDRLDDIFNEDTYL